MSLEAISNRRSIRKYKQDESASRFTCHESKRISTDILNKILEAGRLAP